MKIKKHLTGIAIILILAGSSAVFFNSCKKKEPETIKIGAILPLTGPAAEYGQDALNGLLLAFDQINNEYKNKFSIIVEDSKSNPKDGLNSFRKLVEIEKTRFVIGDILSGVVLSIAPVANAKKVLVFAPGASTPELDQKDDYIYRNWLSDRYDAETLISYAKEKLNVNTLVIFYVSNEYGRTLAQSAKKVFQMRDGKILFEEAFTEDTKDFRNLISKAKAMNPEAWYIIGYSNQTAHFVKQLGEQGALKNSIVLTNLSAEDPQFIEIAKNFLEKVIYSTPAFDISYGNKEVLDFIKIFKNKYGKEPGIAAAHAYDALFILCKAILQTNGNVEDVKKQLSTLKNYKGVSGITTINEYGDAIKEIFIKKFIINNSKIQRVIIAKFSKEIK